MVQFIYILKYKIKLYILILGGSFIKNITITLFAALTIVCVMLANLFLTINKYDDNNSNSQTPKYHIQIITKKSDQTFWETFKLGAKTAAQNSNVYVEFVDIENQNIDNTIDAVDRAIYAKVDGIALQAIDIYNTTNEIIKTKKKGLSVLIYKIDI